MLGDRKHEEKPRRWARVPLTRSGLGVPQEVLPEVVVVLLLGKVNRAVHVAEAVDDEVQGFLVVTHSSEEEDHLEHEITLVAHVVRLMCE